MNYLRHPAWLWLEKHNKEALPPHDTATQALFATGYQFEAVAEKLFPEAARLGFADYTQYRELATVTRAIIDNQQGPRTILQAKFDAGELTCICDAIYVDRKTVDLYEIKSSTKVHKSHIFDLAFQCEVLRRNGYMIRSVTVLTVNTSYVRQGEVVPQDIVTYNDVTEEVFAQEALTNIYIKDALEILHSEVSPHPSPTFLGPLGSMSEWRKIITHIEQPPKYSVYDLVRLDKKRYSEFEAAGITRIIDIPESSALTPAQEMQVLATKRNTPIVNHDAIAAFLDELGFPLYFLDYETYSAVVPYFDGQRPYQQVPFQYSLHILDAPDAELHHVGYLQTEYRHDTQALSESLRDAIGESGSIVTWNMGFEKSCNTTMGALVPEFEEFYTSINTRIVDLCVPFKDLMYVDKQFKGSYSIKNILPVLAPECSYRELNIRDGGTAQALWTQAVLEQKPDMDTTKIFTDLREYCTLDTYAMVAIYQKLMKSVNTPQ